VLVALGVPGVQHSATRRARLAPAGGSPPSPRAPGGDRGVRGARACPTGRSAAGRARAPRAGYTPRESRPARPPRSCTSCVPAPGACFGVPEPLGVPPLGPQVQLTGGGLVRPSRPAARRTAGRTPRGSGHPSRPAVVAAVGSTALPRDQSSTSAGAG
jgi:hypothetical protein